MQLAPATALLLALAVNGAVAQPAVTPGPSQPVRVTNDTSSPVPVAVQGSVGVTGPVTVGNTPSNPVPVTLQGTATVAGAVSLTNALVPVTVIDDLVNQPYIKGHFDNQLVAQDDIAQDGRIIASFALDVPDEKRLIVETVSIYARIPLETPPLPVAIFVGAGSIPYQRTQGDPQDRDDNFRPSELLVANLPMKMRVNARPGAVDELNFTLLTRLPAGQTYSGVKGVYLSGTAFGYLVDLP